MQQDNKTPILQVLLNQPPFSNSSLTLEYDNITPAEIFHCMTKAKIPIQYQFPSEPANQEEWKEYQISQLIKLIVKAQNLASLHLFKNSTILPYSIPFFYQILLNNI